MVQTNFFITEIMNFISCIALPIVLIVASFYIVKLYREVNLAIIRKINAETEKIKK